jgi:hypothetical protein
METASKTSTLAACLQVFRLSLRRQFFTRQTIVMLVLLGLAVLITYLWSLPKPWHPDSRTSAELARQILLPLYMGFLLPVICLGYASAAIADERTDETLVYLLTTNIPRPLVYLSKYAAALLLTLGMALGGLAALCLVPGEIGREALGGLCGIVFAVQRDGAAGDFSLARLRADDRDAHWQHPRLCQADHRFVLRQELAVRVRRAARPCAEGGRCAESV